jgi:hypothetical protein
MRRAEAADLGGVPSHSSSIRRSADANCPGRSARSASRSRAFGGPTRHVVPPAERPIGPRTRTTGAAAAAPSPRRSGMAELTFELTAVHSLPTVAKVRRRGEREALQNALAVVA